MRKRPIRQTFVLKLSVWFPSTLSLTLVDSATFFESYRPSRAPNGALSPARIVDPTLERRPESRTDEQATCDASNSGTSRVRAPETLRTPDHSVSSRELPVEVFHCRPIRKPISLLRYTRKTRVQHAAGAKLNRVFFPR